MSHLRLLEGQSKCATMNCLTVEELGMGGGLGLEIVFISFHMVSTVAGLG